LGSSGIERLVCAPGSGVLFASYRCGMEDGARVTLGDRFHVRRDVEVHVTVGVYAPSHTVGTRCTVPAGTVLVAFTQRNGPGFVAYPERYDEMEATLLPEEIREGWQYAGSYRLHLSTDDIGDLLEPLPPMRPRPANRFPMVSGRPSARQQAAHERLDSLIHALSTLDEHRDERVTEIEAGVWVRRNPAPIEPAVGTSSIGRTWDVWFEKEPGDPPTAPNALSAFPGSAWAAARLVWFKHPPDDGPSFRWPTV
jgi:hypothetical protein